MGGCRSRHCAGGVSIKHYTECEAADYFDEKVSDFFSDCKIKFKEDNIDEKILVWLQGESDSQLGYDLYLEQLSKLHKKCKNLGFTKFFMIRVGYWGDDKILDIMRAQEDFCKTNDDAYMLTRVCSFMKFYGTNEQIYKCNIPNEFMYCRDSFYGFDNQHINEKGFKIIAEYAVPNILRILLDNENPILETEIVKI